MNQTLFLTGASSGIGTATAFCLAKQYNRMALLGNRHKDALSDVVRQLKSQGVDCIYTCGDVGDYDFVNSFVSEALDRFKSIDLLINNAAMSHVGLFSDMTPDEWDTLLKTNVSSIYNTCHAIVPVMVRNHSGRILNISSIWGNAGASCEVAYSATKGAVNAFTRALGKELAPSGIPVNAIAFGVIDTPMNACFTEAEKEKICEDIPAGRMASAHEAAKFIERIVTSPDYLTAQVLTFDGGFL